MNGLVITEISEEQDNFPKLIRQPIRRASGAQKNEETGDKKWRINGINDEQKGPVPKTRRKKSSEEQNWKIQKVKEEEPNWKIREVKEKKEEIPNWTIQKVKETKEEEPNWKIREVKEKKKEIPNWKIHEVKEKKEENSNWKIHEVKEKKEEIPNWKIHEVKEEKEKSWKINSIKENEEPQWKIESIDKKEIEEEAKWQIKDIKEDERRKSIWEIRSVHSEDNEKWSVYEVEEEAVFADDESRCGSIILEESWEEIHKVDSTKKKKKQSVSKVIKEPRPPVTIDYRVPSSSAMVQVNTRSSRNKEKVSKNVKAVKQDSVGKDSIRIRHQNRPLSRASSMSSVFMEDSWEEIRRIPLTAMYEDVTSQQKVMTEQPVPSISPCITPVADHFNYQYNSSRRRQVQPRYLEPPFIPQTDILKQNVCLEQHEEEMVDGRHVPVITVESKHQDMVSVHSVSENVQVAVWPEDMRANVTIDIGVEMWHNNPRRLRNHDKDHWKRKEVNLRRTIELDLKKIEASRKLEEVLKLCSSSKSNGNMVEYSSTSSLDGRTTLKLFRELMSITRNEENRSLHNGMNSKLTAYQSPAIDGPTTAVACEPQYLLTSAVSPSPSFLY